jgi:hypothetical protein
VRWLAKISFAGGHLILKADKMTQGLKVVWDHHHVCRKIILAAAPFAFFTNQGLRAALLLPTPNHPHFRPALVGGVGVLLVVVSFCWCFVVIVFLDALNFSSIYI